MPIFLATLGLLAVVAIWTLRARYIARDAEGLAEVTRGVRTARQRFHVDRRSSRHPAETIDDPVIAIGALAVAFFELDDYPSRAQKAALGYGLAQEFSLSAREAEDLMSLGHWLTMACKGPEAAIARIGKRLYRLDGGTSFSLLMALIKETSMAGSGLSQRQSRALDDLKGVFRLA